MEGRREGERMGSIDKGKRGREKNNKRRERKKKNPQLPRGNFSQYFHVHSFQCILCNLIKIAMYTVG